MDLHSKFQTGNVVRWMEDLYIVADIHDTSLSLLPLRGSNTKSHPSTSWPYLSVDPDDPDFQKPDPTKTVDTVNRVAPDVYSYLLGRIKKVLF